MYTVRLTSTFVGILMILTLMAFVFWTQGQPVLAVTTDDQVQMMRDILERSADTAMLIA